VPENKLCLVNAHRKSLTDRTETPGGFASWVLITTTFVASAGARSID
jgi:hypothetical protein